MGEELAKDVARVQIQVPGAGSRVHRRFERRIVLSVALVSLVPSVGLLVPTRGLSHVVVMVLAVGVAALLARWVARSVTQRLQLLVVATSHVAKGDFTVRVRPRGEDELDALMRAFNAMVEEMQLSRSRIEYLQKIGAWQEFARRLAHEIKNPLTPIQLAVQEVSRKYRGEDRAFQRTLDTAREIVEEEVATLRRLVEAFSSFARLPEVRLARGDLAVFVREVASSHEFLAEVSEEATHFESPEGGLPIELDKILLRRALENLVRNAHQAGAKNVWVRAELHPGAHEAEPEAWLIVEDDGPGVPANLRAKVWESYYTTKQDGTGLGLAIVRKIALDHRGDVGLEERVGGGARFVLTLPLMGVERGLSFVTFGGTRPEL